jgi:predicted 2-oxoglutarate/Fe(II)-dependent dioxygenase YbiX
VYRIRADFFDAATCRNVRAAMDRGVAEPAEILGMTMTHDGDVRRASSVEVDENTLRTVEAALDAEREAIAGAFGLALGGREGTGFLRYPPGGFYRAHRDQALVRSWRAAARRQIAVVVFLNSSRECPRAGEFSGGELRLFNQSSTGADEADSLIVSPQQGSLVAFPAVTLHEVLAVREGVRDVVVDWYY